MRCLVAAARQRAVNIDRYVSTCSYVGLCACMYVYIYICIGMYAYRLLLTRVFLESRACFGRSPVFNGTLHAALYHGLWFTVWGFLMQVMGVNRSV